MSIKKITTNEKIRLQRETDVGRNELQIIVKSRLLAAIKR